MGIQNLIAMGKEYFILGVFGIALLMAAVFVVYKFLLKGKKKFTFSQILGWLLLGSYTVVILGATMFMRVETYQSGSILRLFYAYRDAWVNFSVAAWRNLILNICMFVPLGILLPSLMRCFRSFWKTYLAGFLFTLCIEGMQLLGKRGIFELDDMTQHTWNDDRIWNI